MEQPSSLAASVVVEVADQMDGILRAQLVAAAYRMSSSGPVILVLTGLNAAGVDRMLDPVVRAVGCGVHGLRYLDAADEPAVLKALERCRFVIASSGPFYTGMLVRNLAVLRAEDVVGKPERGEYPAPACASSGVAA